MSIWQICGTALALMVVEALAFWALLQHKQAQIDNLNEVIKGLDNIVLSQRERFAAKLSAKDCETPCNACRPLVLGSEIIPESQFLRRSKPSRTL